MAAPKGRKFSVIALQFRFPTLDSVPPFTRQIARRPTKTSNPATLTGEQIVGATEGTSILALLDDLKAKGYDLVNACCEERRNVKGPGSHYIARYTFATAESGLSITERFEYRKATFLRELAFIGESALWKNRTFSNPFIRDGKPVTGFRAASLVFDTRQPFYQGDGQPVTVWLKDEAGERIGDAPIPLAPSHHLRYLKTKGFRVVSA
ncbi:MAG: hypothetical protein UY31_C0018G0010 [Candidatus Wolfebacteria bacterium GW2011_GWE1_48_7]|uniref:Uncharacterized protein n=2 Tax=Candidatus Wolfeibacteriota TaxID=1752735 RepID=A0A0G1U8V0_9BACT|nr:MAG: hypothetical protein UX70_C0001G0841 [Candidatus Wolfebacteria bacterium GW2011_GWB1_47_1]KKU36273.1 MAG: hypothetical protein UX49_C0019G0019 [Candidatus Wolfebacteria bacterium GW2011_GWC2_46_275]KKU42128.1 MAG: hypothetical protein UX58_C0003G0052 [Candidatus Wolfebacteria bacterium GW2011_GWB2_46_69]KKU54096.1 MAG: hypothetical protein UX76_C0006G0062 [Candidatus Wolfebacteria bacterium GW2011_GWC1_47_103]KKU59283.1 MAG: hypothetical protein UX83_C0006G0053 [Candidatus Wolfebacteria